MIRLRAFRAINEPNTCKKFLQEHIKVLIEHGIANITTNEDLWMSNPSVYCIVAELIENNEIIGGIRIHLLDGKNELPLETAVGKIDKNIYDLVGKKDHNKTGEICALWNAIHINNKGYGLSYILVRAGIALVEQLDLDYLYTLCAEYSLKMVSSMGFQVEKSIGNEGTFSYPNSNYLARVLRRLNTTTLEHTFKEHKQKILELRENPNQISDEEGRYGPIRIQYHLKLEGV